MFRGLHWSFYLVMVEALAFSCRCFPHELCGCYPLLNTSLLLLSSLEAWAFTNSQSLGFIMVISYQ